MKKYLIEPLRVFWVTVVAAVAVWSFYRVRLYASLYSGEGKIAMFGFKDIPPDVATLLGYMSSDVSVAVGLGAVAQIVAGAALLLRKFGFPRISRAVFGIVFAVVTISLVVFIGVATAAHRIALETGLGIGIFVSTYLWTSFTSNPLEVVSQLTAWCS